jgi:hypothetical protein
MERKAEDIRNKEDMYGETKEGAKMDVQRKRKFQKE